MGNVLVRILQRAVPALKEHQKTIEILQNQNLLKDQEIINLQAQRDLIEQHVGKLSSELAATNIKVEELKLNSKRILMVGGLCAVAGYFYIRNSYQSDILDTDRVSPEPGGQGVEREVIEVPDSLECIICMENMKEVMLEPCGHVCICRECAERMRLSSGRVKCPVCRIRADTRTVFIT